MSEIIQAGTTNIVIESDILLYGQYLRIDSDLQIRSEFKTVLIKDYFQHTPTLSSLKGSTITPKLVSLLAINTTPGFVAFEDPNAIGKITIAEGTVIIQRANQQIELQEGDLIYLNDVVEAKGGSVGIAFADQTTLSVDNGSRMVVDEFVYDPEEPTTGSMNANVITGNFSFVSGEIAKAGNDAMTVTTPVLTIGVRGTQVAGKALQEGEENEIVLLPNADGSVGQILITTQSGSVLLTEAFQATTITSSLMPPTVPVILPKAIVLKKFAETISTTRKAEAKAETDRKIEEAKEEQEKLEEEKEELEEEKEELEEEKEELEEEKEELEEEKEELEEEKEELEEEKEELEKKEDKLEEEVQQLEEELKEADSQEEKEEIEEKLQEVEEEIQEVVEVKEEIKEKFEEVEQKEEVIEQKEEVIEQKVEVIKEKVEIVEEKFEKVEQQVIVYEEKIHKIEEKFEQEMQKFDDVFKEEMDDAIDEYREEKEEAIKEEKQQIEEEKEELEEKLEEADSQEEKEELEKQLEEIEHKEEIIEQEEKHFKEEFKAEVIEDIFEETNQEDNVEELKENLADVLEESDQNNIVEDDIFNVVEEQVENFDLDEIEQSLEEEFNQDIELNQDEMIEYMTDDLHHNISGSPDDLTQEELDLIIEDDIAYDDEQDEEWEDAFSQWYDELIEEIAEEEDINVAPWLDMPNNTSVDERLSVNSEIFDIGGSDANGDTLTYSLYSDPTGKLAINSTTGKITLASAFSVTADTEYNIWVQVSDGSLSDLDYLTLTVENNHSPSVSSQDDGTKMFMLGYNTDTVHEYTLSTAFDVSTASYVDGFSVASQENLPASVTFNNAGNKMFVAGNTGDDINEYTLSTAWDVSTASYDSNFSMSSQLNEAFGVAWNIEGTKMFVADAGNGNDINEYTLTTAFDVSTASFVDALSVNSQDSRPCGITFNNDGTKIFMAGFNSDYINEYNLSTAYDISTGSYSKQFSVNAQGIYPRDVDFNPTGTVMWVVNGQDDSIDTYNLSTAFDVSTASFSSAFSVNSQDGNPFSIAFNNSSVTLAESVSSGTAVATISATDNESETLTYSISSGNSDSKFTINSTTGAITTAASLNYEDETQYTLGIAVSDGLNTSTTSQVIHISNVNEAPTIASMNTVSLAENVSSGTSVATASGSDVDANTTLTYSITAGNGDGKFTINSSTGAITTAASLDYETTTSYTLTVQVSDGSLTATTNQVVNITDVAETTQYTKSLDFGSVAAWGARYSHDMVLNNAWAEGKALVMHGDRTLSGSTQLGGNLGDTQAGSLSVSYDNDSAGNFSTMSLAYVSQFSQIWDGNWNTRVNNNSDLTDLWGKYIMAGGSLVVVTEHSYWDSKKNADVEDFINVIDTTSSTNAGLISSNGPNPQHLQPDYLGYSEGSSELSLNPGSATSTYHKEYMGRGDLVFQETSNDNDGAVAEWSREDTESVYTGAFLAWGDIDAHSNVSAYGSEQAHWEIARWLTIQNEDAITEDDGAEIVIDSEYIPIFGDSYGTATHTSENDITAVESFHLGNNVYIGGGMDHIDFVWDDAQITVASTETGYSVASQETGPRGLAFSSDGTKFFVAGYQGNDVGEYSMSTAWDVSTASYVDAFSLSSQTGQGVMGLDFNTDGTKMFVVSYANDSIYEYHLSTGWDVSTASYDSAFDVSSQDTDPRGLAFSNDGTKMFVTGDAGNDISEYTLSTGFDISTASYVDSLDVSSYDTTVRDIAFNDDGTKMFYHGQQNNDVHLWSLSTAFDISTATYNSAVSLPSFDTGAEDIEFSSDGSKLFVTGNDDNTIDEYTLSGGWDQVDKPYWAFNTDMDNGATPTQADDHYGVITVDADGDGDLFETTDTFNLDKIKIHDDSEDFLTQDSDASGDYYLKVTPVTYESGSWNVETSNTVTVTNTTGYNAYLDLSSNTDFDDINYALIETESALISEVIASY